MNLKDALTLAIPTLMPTLMVLVGILLNQRAIDRLDGRISALETSLRGEINSLRGEMNALRSQFHSDILMLMGRDTDKDARLSRLEEREK